MNALDADGTVTLPDGRTLMLDLHVAHGEIVGLVGPNGAGKSATLAALVGALGVTAGRIRAGEPLGWVPQDIALLPRMRVRRQVATFAGRGAPLLDGDDAIDRVLAHLGLSDLAHARPATLSRGQAQRVAVARAFLSAPVVLLDEPTSAQDARGAQMIRELARTHAAAGGAVLVVAHEPEDAYLLADRIVVLEDGAVAQTGTPSELAAHPATPYVGRVVGATVVTGTVTDGRLVADVGVLEVGTDVPEGAATAIVRPDVVTLHTERPGHTSARNVLPGVVSGIDDRGSGVFVRVATAPPLVARLTRRAVDDLRLAVGSEVWASVKATEVTVYPR